MRDLTEASGVASHFKVKDERLAIVEALNRVMRGQDDLPVLHTPSHALRCNSGISTSASLSSSFNSQT